MFAIGEERGRAHVMLSSLVGDVILRPDKDGLWAEMHGDLHALLEAANGTSAGGRF